MELTDDGALKTTTKKGNGVNIRVMKVITILSTLNLTLNYEKNIFLDKFPASSHQKVEGDSIMTENVLTLKDGTEIVSKEKFNKIE